MFKLRVALTGFCFFSFLISGQISADDWKDRISRELQSIYTPTKVSFDESRITEPGSLLVLQVDGLVLSSAAIGPGSKTTIRDGKILGTGGSTGIGARSFNKGEKVYSRKIKVKDDSVDVEVISEQMYDLLYDGQTQSRRFEVTLRFEFSKSALQGMSAQDIKTAIDTILLKEEEMSSIPDQPRVVSKNQSFAEVEKILGKPQKIINLDNKTIWIYPDLKVVFDNGKVADVE